MQINLVSAHNQSFGTALTVPKGVRFNKSQQEMVKKIYCDLRYNVYGKNGLIWDAVDKATSTNVHITPAKKGINVSLISYNDFVGGYVPIDKKGKKIVANIDTLASCKRKFTEFMAKVGKFAQKPEPQPEVERKLEILAIKYDKALQENPNASFAAMCFPKKREPFAILLGRDGFSTIA